MQIDRCKSCGGDLERVGNSYVCRFCGSKWVIDADQDVHVIDRANAWSALRDCDFERATELFENIIFKEPQNHEAYWGRALANAGIMYVTDFHENKKVPTCNSISESSFIDSRDVKRAIELAPADIAESYRAQAEQIESIRVEWVKKASREPAYDVFISYKDSDREHHIERTDDSYDAHELYNALTAEGYKVFFSRVSLRDKVSEHYEPYIYNAIKIAKVMIVFGEKPEYFNAVWIKNEWMRFRKRIEAGEKHQNSLVVAYKGFDPADLPVGLRSRQCLDAGGLTFLEDLKRHIAKIVRGEKKAAAVKIDEPAAPVEVAEKKKSKKGIIIAAIAAVLSVCIGIGFAISNLAGDNGETTPVIPHETEHVPLSTDKESENNLETNNSIYDYPNDIIYNNEHVEITFYHSMGVTLQEILNDAIADFNELYPNITVVHKSLGDYDGVRDQIKTEISVEKQPNIAYCYPDHVALYNLSGAVQPLDGLINNQKHGLTDDQIADFIPGFFEEGRAYGDGKMYTLPISKSTEVLYYNKTFFDENDLEVPKTWDEMKALCEQIKKIDPTCIPLGHDSEANWFITMCEQYGSDYTSATGDNFLFDNEQNRAFVKEFRSWFQNKLVTTQEIYGGYTSDLFTGGDDGSVTTRCYMCIGSTGGATYQQPNRVNGKYEFEVGITSIPQINPDKPKVISQGPSVCIFKKDNPQEVLATWLFAKFLTTDINFQAAVSMNNGYAPVIQSVKEHPVYAEFLASASTANMQAYAVKVALEQADAYYSSPAFNGSSVARDQVGLLIQKCFTSEATDVDAMIKKAFEDAIAECKYLSNK